MSKIRQVIIQNFKNFKNPVIVDLHSNLNEIIGESTHGKSTLVRAILWVLTNRPLGADFINWTAKPSEVCVVTLITGDDVIQRARSKDGTINEYVVNGTKLTKFGSTVPHEVSSLFNINELNIVNQFEPHFMLASSEGERAKMLNAVLKLDDIDEVFKIINRKARENTKEIKMVAEEISSLESALSNYSEISYMDKIASKLGDLSEKYSVISSQLNDIGALIEGYMDLIEIEEVPISIEDTNQLEFDFLNVTASLEKLNYYISQLEAIGSREIPLRIAKAYDKAEELISKLNDSPRQSLEDSLYELVEAEEVLAHHSSAKDRTEAEYEALREELGVCPVCGNSLI